MTLSEQATEARRLFVDEADVDGCLEQLDELHTRMETSTLREKLGRTLANAIDEFTHGSIERGEALLDIVIWKLEEEEEDEDEKGDTSAGSKAGGDVDKPR